MTDFYYVYILQSKINPARHYTGSTDDLEQRLKAHNQGKCKHTSKLRPWEIKNAIAFTDKKKATDFEDYLKTSSGRAFTNKSFVRVSLHLTYRRNGERVG